MNSNLEAIVKHLKAVKTFKTRHEIAEKTGIEQRQVIHWVYHLRNAGQLDTQVKECSILGANREGFKWNHDVEVDLETVGKSPKKPAAEKPAKGKAAKADIPAESPEKRALKWDAIKALLMVEGYTADQLTFIEALKNAINE